MSALVVSSRRMSAFMANLRDANSEANQVDVYYLQAIYLYIFICIKLANGSNDKFI